MRVPWEENQPAQELLRRAVRVRVEPPPGASARVWRKLQERRGHEADRPTRRRLGWAAMFAAGAACAAAIAIFLVPHASNELTIATSTEPATIDLADDGRVVAGPSTMARVERSGRGDRLVTLTLDHGSVLAHVKPRDKQAPFVIQTPAFRARVVGTVLRVVAHEDGSSSIAVGHGAVEVTPNGGRPRMVRSGERWPIGSPDSPSGDELARMGADDLEGAGAAAFSPPALPKPAAAPTPAPPQCRALHGEAAVACWLRLGDETDPVRAESALYQAGWIRMHEMHDAAFALGVWERERERFPHGVLRDEVQTSIVDALVALKRTRSAEAEISDYLRAHPHGLRSAEMHYVRGTLLRAEDRSCKRARREFDVALEHPAAPWAARAHAARVSCR